MGIAQRIRIYGSTLYQPLQKEASYKCKQFRTLPRSFCIFHNIQGLRTKCIEKVGLILLNLAVGQERANLFSSNRCRLTGAVMSEDKNSPKIISDPIHGQIRIHPLCVAIIDTTEFQRLRRIKQLGVTYTVYPSAINDRFSHSLGVSYLARKFLTELLNNSSDEIKGEVSEKDILCVEVAGLCHDLGHGPFSHVWEAFMKEANKDRDKEAKESNKDREIKTEGPDLIEWEHEKLSLSMLDYLKQKKEYDLENKFKAYGVDVEIVKELIIGKRGKGKSMPLFLYQIVNNEESGLDVDKWDYYLRDCHHLGMHCSFEYERLIRFAKVMKVDGEYQICFRDKVKPMVYSMFRTRSELHHLAYQHRVVKTMEQMIVDTLVKMDNPKGQRNDDAISNMQSWWEITKKATKGDKESLRLFCELDDNVVYSRLFDNKIIDGMERRTGNKYRFIKQWSITKRLDIDETKSDISKIMLAKKNTTGVDHQDMLNAIVVQVVRIHWGKKDQNPVKSVRFYRKDDSVIGRSDNDESDELWMQPRSFQDIQVRILCRMSNEKVCSLIREVCESYFEKK